MKILHIFMAMMLSWGLACANAGEFEFKADNQAFAIVDLAGYTNDSTFVISFTDTAPLPDNQWTNATDKTYLREKLVLRRIDEKDENNAVTNSYYLGIFPIMQGQKKLIGGSSSAGDATDWEPEYWPDESELELTVINLKGNIDTEDLFEIPLSPVAINNLLGYSTSATSQVEGVVDGDAYLYLKTSHLLTVVDGTGGGIYCYGAEVEVEATPPLHSDFKVWTNKFSLADLGSAFNASNATTTIVMPFEPLTLTAEFEPHKYQLVVEGGTGGGSYTNGHVVTIEATNTAEVGFSYWSGDTNTVADIYNPETTLRIDGTNYTVTAMDHFELTVAGGTILNADESYNGGYTNGQPIRIKADLPPTAQHEFAYWTNLVNITLGDLYSDTIETLMPDRNVSLQAVYQAKKAISGVYMVVDLEDGAVEYLEEMPASGWSDSHKKEQLVLRKIPQGSFRLGASGSMITITRDFYLSIFETTQGQWSGIMGTNSSTQLDTPGMRPVESVTMGQVRGLANWPAVSAVDAASFVGELRSRIPALNRVDLPTEAQWEYACRADGAVDPVASAWFGGSKHQAVGGRQPNGWGLYDMLGNVAEMTLDWWADSYRLPTVPQEDPTGANTMLSQLKIGSRTLKGGSYLSTLAEVTPSFRTWHPITNAWTLLGEPRPAARPNVGFRLAAQLDTASYYLTIVGGHVNTGGLFAAGSAIGLSAQKRGAPFKKWEISPHDAKLGDGFDASAAETLMRMPQTDLRLTARYEGLYILRLSYKPEQSLAVGQELPLQAPPAPLNHRFSRWQVVPAGLELGIGFNPGSPQTTLTMPAADLTLTPLYELDLSLEGHQNASAGVTFELDGSGGLEGAFSAKGLPKGLKINRKTGMISGIPSKAGDFSATITVKMPDRQSVSFPLEFTIAPIPQAAIGTFTGYTALNAGGSEALSGLVTIKATNRGRITAKIVAQGGNLSFSAKSWSASTGGILQATLERRQGEQLELRLDVASATIEGTLSGGKLAGLPHEVYCWQNRALNRQDLQAQASLNHYLGYYTVALPVGYLESNPALNNTQEGSGYLTVTVRARGAVKVAGRLADGTRVSIATTLLLLDDNTAAIPLFSRLYGKRGYFSGLLLLDGTALSLEIKGDAQLPLNWFYPGRSARLVDDSFSARLDGYGGLYSSLLDLQQAYQGADFRIDLPDETWLLPLIASGNSIAIAKGPENPAAVTFKVAKRSGIFSGGFKYQESGAAKPQSYKHLGILIQGAGGWQGEGSYLRKRSESGYTLKESKWVGVP